MAALSFLGYRGSYVWHDEVDLDGYDALILPGGFSYGDYLRCGAIARFSPVMNSLQTYAASGRPVLGICNGFQILTEAGLLPGVLLRNRDLKFLCQPVYLRVEPSVCQWLDLKDLPVGSVIELPINHGEGNFYCDDLTLGRLEAKGQIVLRYSGAPEALGVGAALGLDGTDGFTPNEKAASDIVAGGFAPNGSLDDIAGICNERGNVFGLMPHPERATDGLAGSDGQYFFAAIAKRLVAQAEAGIQAEAVVQMDIDTQVVSD